MSRWESIVAFRVWEQGAGHREDTEPLRLYRDERVPSGFAFYEVDASYRPPSGRRRPRSSWDRAAAN
ncbi:hypothetical protein OG909_08500 [Streptomyces sp. NBC_01754]|uniref:hypothetical protein n=1 Tax=Streptomyces sp. NBC_01754 TaxID=2975930 RepID=UPI002DDB37B4|nr:hypothetical protein [Streptomyces sp. NBC_01754]WSC92331.1 hypothetical protein OG909_08500 [Streptomyces sp. NBC_01754]